MSDTDEVKARDKELIKENRLLECTALKFTHRAVPIVLNRYSIVHDTGVNYDRTGNVLIGMDILQDFDFHCGESRANGDYIFLGCLRERIGMEYLEMLDRHFGYNVPYRVDTTRERDCLKCQLLPGTITEVGLG